MAIGPAAAQGRFAVTPVTVVHVNDGTLRADQTVLVKGERIAAVGPVYEVAVPDGTTVVDGRGGYLIPGLWDMHVHAFNFIKRAEAFSPLRANPLRDITPQAAHPCRRRRRTALPPG